jgi:HEAT repeat protein
MQQAYIHILNFALQQIALIFSCFAALIILLTFLYLYQKKRNFFFKKRISTHLDTWISAAILEELEYNEAEEVIFPPILYKILKNPLAGNIAINELITAKKNLTGKAAENLVKIYEQLKLNEISENKLSSKKWHKKIQGVQELYLMNQHKHFLKIYRLTNSKNNYLRAEAQTAIIHMAGYNGLRFLNILDWPLTNWHQTQMLENLSSFTFKEQDAQIIRWLQSKNSTVVIFALRLIALHKQFQLLDNVFTCTQHEDEIVRQEAIATLVEIPGLETGNLLTQLYHKETENNQLQILNCLAEIGTENQLPFLLDLLNNNNDLIKLKAAKAIAATGPVGIDYLAAKAIAQPNPFQDIYLHVKAGLAA